MIFDDSYGITDEDIEEVPSLPPISNRNSIVQASQKSGWLKKQSNNMIKSWSFRYFALDNNRLYYYKHPSDKVPLGVINFDQVNVTLQAIPPESPQRLSLIPLNSSHTISIRSPSSSDLQEWAAVLYQTILNSKGRTKRVSNIGARDKFWKYERISNADFIETVDTGDILLFRSRDMGSKISRGVLGSSYDHIALIIKYVSGSVALLEATTADGVNIIMWDEFVANEWFAHSERLMFRQLITERTDKMLLKLEEFVKKVDGKNFKISPVKLLQRINSMPGEENSFFCSELIASAYKAMGLLSSEVPANQYWPGDFSIEKDLNLIGAKLGREIMVDFALE